MSDIYQAPAVNLDVPVAASGGNVEDAIAGRFEFSAVDTISKSWKILKGFKRNFWLAYLLYIVVFFAYMLAGEFLLSAAGLASTSLTAQLLLNLGSIFIFMPMVVGMMVMCIKRAGQAEVSATDIVQYFGKGPKLVGAYLLFVILGAIGFLLLVLPGIYLLISWTFAWPLMVEKNMGIWEAMETSRKAVTHCWFRMLGMLILLMLIMLVSMIPLGLGIIWTMPLFMLAYGVAYHNIFGYSGQS